MPAAGTVANMDSVGLLPGDFSSAGRNTGRRIRMLRGQCQLGEAALAAAENGGKTPKARSPKKAGAAISSPTNTTASEPNSPKPVAASKPAADPSTPATTLPKGYYAILGLSEGDDGTQDGKDIEKTKTEASKKERSQTTSAFTSLGQDAKVFCDGGASVHGRFVFPVRLETKPEVGRYSPAHKVVQGRLPHWDFGERGKHPSRRDPDRYNELDPFRSQDMSSLSFSMCSEISKSGEEDARSQPMGMLSPRLEMRFSMGRTAREPIIMNEASDHARPWHELDKKSSRKWREADIDFDNDRGRAYRDMGNYWNPGRYRINKASKFTSSRPKNMVRLAKKLGRSVSQGQYGHYAPVDSLQEEGESIAPDRSLHRAGPSLRSRVLSVNDFSQDLPRPPLAKPVQIYYNEEDAEAADSVLTWEKTFDAFGAKVAVEPRHDHSFQMNRSLARQRAGMGSRIFQGDRALRSSRGMSLPDPRSLEDTSIEQCKESPSRLRPIAGVGFGLVKSRSAGASANPHVSKNSANGKPIAHPNESKEFERVAPQPGLVPRVSVMRRTLETQRSRSYHEMTDWSKTMQQEAEAASTH